MGHSHLMPECLKYNIYRLKHAENINEWAIYVQMNKIKAESDIHCDLTKTNDVRQTCMNARATQSPNTKSTR